MTVNAALGTPRKEGEAKSFYRGKLAAQGKGLKSTTDLIFRGARINTLEVHLTPYSEMILLQTRLEVCC